LDVVVAYVSTAASPSLHTVFLTRCPAYRTLHSFPTRRSSDLKASMARTRAPCASSRSLKCDPMKPAPPVTNAFMRIDPSRDRARSEEHTLNSSHVEISYAVFCLKKKKKRTKETNTIH